MAGHSKWANIRYTKARQDALRGKQFTKLIRKITVSAHSQYGGSDPELNPTLRAAILKAQQANIPKNTIQRAIQRSQADTEGESLLEVQYEAYVSGGVALIIDCLTDNKNRTVAEVRHVLSKSDASLGATGCVAYLFHQRGLIHFSSCEHELAMMECALELEVLDVISKKWGMTVITEPDKIMTIDQQMKSAGFLSDETDITYLPDRYIALDTDQQAQLSHLIDKLNDLDDVQRVYTNGILTAGYE